MEINQIEKENKLCPECLEWLGKIDSQIKQEKTENSEVLND